ncbi:DUF192 domain-containing protein [Massilia sp. CF038]|jgi:uncharacterized membrane protein (UPF0127 family)|uniref:DUF192 domain-containing protein n=1 Tax=Massilia sp. CF038 TaxID=1881045 RepID=UPI000919F2F9|nr:DUF192 domain-containing protein [Massilia sp. CF038]SHH13969.1 hypothetical protein SAMN05428948_2983 [Massilia sp. CF038]
MNKFLATTSSALLLLAAGSAMAQTAFGSAKLSAGMHMIKAEVAANDPQRQQGLMFREKMEPNHGMVFVFEGVNGQCMWMKNTLLPLSVAFIDEAGKIVNIEDMQPQTLDSHCSTKPVRYALEMNLGWFKQKNIKPGMTIGGLPAAK